MKNKIKRLITILWALKSSLLALVGVGVWLSSTTTIRVNGADVNSIFGIITLLFSLFCMSIAYSIHRTKISYAFISALILVIVWSALLVGQITLLATGELVVYKYLYAYGLALLVALTTMVYSFLQYRGNINA